MEEIPNEILWIIISYLKNKDLVRFSLTSRRNRFLVSNSKNNNGDIKLKEKDYKIFLFKDFNLKPRLFSLDLSCTKVTDVSALGNVHTLDLSCTKVTDVSALRHQGVESQARTLNLRCTNVTDTSMLKNVKIIM